MSKITLSSVGSILDATSAATTINSNNTTIQTAFDNTLSRDGTSPNTMAAPIDMNSQRVLNLPVPATSAEPLRLTDLNSFVGGGTVTNIPAGGTTGQVLAKTTNADYAVGWTSESAELTAGTNIVLTGSTPTTISTTLAPSFTSTNITGLTPSSAVATDGSRNLVSVTNTGTGNNVLATTPTITTPAISSPTLSGTVVGNNTIPLSILAQASGGTVLGNTTGSTANITATSTPVLGIAGTTVGTVGLQNATSGTITITPPTGALGSVSNTLQAVADTFVYKATTDTLTNKTLTTPVLNGIPTGTGVASTATASTLLLRDSNANGFLNNDIRSYTTTVTAAGTTTLTVGSTYQQLFTGSSTQTVVLPVTSGLVLGFSFYIQNNSTGNVTVQSSGANNIVILPGGTSAVFTCILTSGTTAASWTYNATSQAGQSLATATNDSANAGNVGEFISSTVLVGSPVSLTSTVGSTITSISLTPGDWDVAFSSNIVPGGTTNVTVFRSSISLTNNTENVVAGFYTAQANAGVPPTDLGQMVGPARFSLASTTTIFGVIRATFTVSTCGGYGLLRARRLR